MWGWCLKAHHTKNYCKIIQDTCLLSSLYGTSITTLIQHKNMKSYFRLKCLQFVNCSTKMQILSNTAPASCYRLEFKCPHTEGLNNWWEGRQTSLAWQRCNSHMMVYTRWNITVCVTSSLISKPFNIKNLQCNRHVIYLFIQSGTSQFSYVTRLSHRKPNTCSPMQIKKTHSN